MTSDNSPPCDEATLLRRERRRLLVGAGVAGSVVLTVPSRSVLAGTAACTRSVWTSFTANPKGFASHSTVSAAFGDSPATWYKYCSNYGPKDVPANWANIMLANYTSYFTLPSGVSVKINNKADQLSNVNMRLCLQGVVVYSTSKPSATYNPQQAAAAYINALYYVAQGVYYFYGKSPATVVTDFAGSKGLSTLASMASTYGSTYNLH